MEDKKLNDIKQVLKMKQISVIKKAVMLTFEKLEELEKQKNIIQNHIKILRHDLYDLKDGRLDRILERQSLNDPKANVSVAIVTKVSQVNNEFKTNTSPWYDEYEIKINDDEPCRINNSIIKTHASGSYKLSSNEVRYL